MLEKLHGIIKYDSESAHVDFKSQEYPLGNHAKKNELLKDISAMANHPSDAPKYILIGIKEKDGVASDFIDVVSPTDQAKYQQFIEENIEPKINFEYISFEYEGHRLAAFIIADNQERPYLFKKNLQRADGRAQEFRVGDGFIRTGTSIKKLNRGDFESIYSKKYEEKDRKPDLQISPILRRYTEMDIEGQVGCFIIDFAVENLTSRSIGFDAEFKMLYKKGVCLQKKFDFEDQFKEKGLEAIYPQHFTPKVDSTIFDLQVEERSNFYKVLRLSRLNEKYAVTISQRNHDESIFLGEILILSLTRKCGDCIISIELTLRSDEFRTGPLEMKYEFDLKSLNDGT